MTRHGNAAGLALPELMVALTISLVLILASTTLMMLTRSAYLLVDDRSRMEESGRFAVDAIGRAVRQAGFREWSVAGIADAAWPAVAGLDAQSLRDAADGMDPPYGATVNGSDVLALRFDGSAADGGAGLQHCAGAVVPADVSGAGWSIFYVANDSGGEPELRCKYRAVSGWNSDALVRGVDSFQVLYGLEGSDDAAPLRYVTAAALEREGSAWQRVAAVRFALLLHGVQPGSERASRYDLFGADYADDADFGARLVESQFPAASRGLLRRVYRATVYLRNRSRGAL